MIPFSRRGYFKLAKHSGGVGRYAVLEVVVSQDEAQASPYKIVWKQDAFRVNGGTCKSTENERGAVMRGIVIALKAYPEPVAEVQIHRAEILAVDTTENYLAYAACFAVWDALQVCGCDPPRLENGEFHFPENP